MNHYIDIMPTVATCTYACQEVRTKVASAKWPGYKQ